MAELTYLGRGVAFSCADLVDIVDEDEHTRIMRCGEACPILLCLEITIDRSQLENAHGETSVVGIATKSGDRHGVVVVRLHESLNLVKEEVRVDRDGLKDEVPDGVRNVASA